jgi:hypothetical protein
VQLEDSLCDWPYALTRLSSCYISLCVIMSCFKLHFQQFSYPNHRTGMQHKCLSIHATVFVQVAE